MSDPTWEDYVRYARHLVEGDPEDKNKHMVSVPAWMLVWIDRQLDENDATIKGLEARVYGQPERVADRLVPTPHPTFCRK